MLKWVDWRNAARITGAAVFLSSCAGVAAAQQTTPEADSTSPVHMETVAPSGPAGPEEIHSIAPASGPQQSVATTLPSADMEQVIPLPWTAAPAAAIVDPLRTAIGSASIAQGGAIAKFYASRNDAPLWVDGRGWTDRGHAARDRIANAAADGLDPAEFALPPATLPDHSPEVLAHAEIALSVAAIAYARTAEGGRIDPSRLGPNIDEHPPRPDPAAVLAKLAGPGDVAALLDSYNPPEPQFHALRKKLAELRGAEVSVDKSLPTVPPGPILRPGMRGPRVALLRARLGVWDPAAESDIYDRALTEAVVEFQRHHGLVPDGQTGRNTIAALNGGTSTSDPIPLILANMERWRWLPRDLGKTHVMVNVPEFVVRVVRNGEVVHQAEVIVGKPDHQTPIFSNTIQFLVVNPYWHVPKSIAAKEIIPHILRDPNYLARENLQVLYRGHPIDPWSVDWARVNPAILHFRQAPGADNALGRIKFLFPNKFSVYLHDTPQKSLFRHSARAFSHGCVRVQDPFAFAGALIEGSDLSLDRIRKLVGGGEHWIRLSRPIPIHIVYFTAWVNDEGTLVTRPDLYGYDHEIEALLAAQTRMADRTLPDKIKNQ